jgi:hypothetical protein
MTPSDDATRGAGDDDLAGRHGSIWMDTSERTDYDPLDGDRHVDVAVVGGGIAGVTTAYELVQAGRSVAVLERDRILDATTGRTTAKVTSLHGLVYDHLIDHFGVERAQQYADANQTAIEHVADTVDALDIDCEFGRAPAYTYVDPGGNRGDVRAEVDAARRLGLPVSFVEETDLPYEVGGAVRFDDQAYFHPRKYLLALAAEVDDADDTGGVFEETTVRDVVVLVLPLNIPVEPYVLSRTLRQVPWRSVLAILTGVVVGWLVIPGLGLADTGRRVERYPRVFLVGAVLSGLGAAVYLAGVAVSDLKVLTGGLAIGGLGQTIGIAITAVGH